MAAAALASPAAITIRPGVMTTCANWCLMRFFGPQRWRCRLKESPAKSRRKTSKKISTLKGDNSGKSETRRRRSPKEIRSPKSEIHNLGFDEPCSDVLSVLFPHESVSIRGCSTASVMGQLASALLRYFVTAPGQARIADQFPGRVALPVVPRPFDRCG